MTGTFPRQSLRVVFEDALTGMKEIDFSELIDGFVFENLKFEMQEARGTIDITSMKLNKEIILLVDQECTISKAPNFYPLRCPEVTAIRSQIFESKLQKGDYPFGYLLPYFLRFK